MSRAMSEGVEIEVSPEEQRFLARFFRRQAAPWFVASVMIGVTAAWGLRGGADDALEVRTSAALAQLRAENERLREEVTALTQSVQATEGAGRQGAQELERSVEDARRNVRMIEARVTAALERRIDALEARVANQPARPAGNGEELPPDASAWDVSAILERLYALEMRETDSGGGGASPAAAVRISELERRLARLEGRGTSRPAPPAAPAP